MFGVTLKLNYTAAEQKNHYTDKKGFTLNSKKAKQIPEMSGTKVVKIC